MEIVQKVLIDTNVYSHAMRGDPEIALVLRTVSSIRLSVVSIGELLSGFRGGRKEKLNRRLLAEFLDTPRVTVHPIDEDTAEFYSVILNQLRKDGRPIPTNDLWIAATALQHGLPLLTKDKHFSKVDGLLLVGWSSPRCLPPHRLCGSMIHNMTVASEKKLLITEMYPSIQGESTWAGLPCFFIRLTGCPLRCVWCDTEYAFYGGERRTISDLVQAAVDSGLPLVEVTGGEPLAQPNCPDLCRALLDHHFTVLVETAGSETIEVLPEGVIRIMDFKCPDSGEMDKNLWSNLDHLNNRDEVKFVIASRTDFDWAADVVRRERLAERVRAVLFSPVFGAIDPRDLVAWILADNLPVRFQLQMHKIVWDPKTQGV